nr:hypothetical protein [Tanacetum cinerariifolium]
MSKAKGQLMSLLILAVRERACISHLSVMITRIQAVDDRLEVYDSLECLKESKKVEYNKLIALNNLIALTEENIRLKEGHVEAMKDAINFV